MKVSHTGLSTDELRQDQGLPIGESAAATLSLGVDPCVGLSLLGESFRPEEPSSLEFEEEITLWKPRLVRNVLEVTPFGVDSGSARFWGIIRGCWSGLGVRLSASPSKWQVLSCFTALFPTRFSPAPET
jgi:hypothetical protein